MRSTSERLDAVEQPAAGTVVTAVSCSTMFLCSTSRPRPQPPPLPYATARSPLLNALPPALIGTSHGQDGSLGCNRLVATYGAFADDDLLSHVVMERMLAGLATRRHRSANEPVGAAVEAEASSTSKSAVSRRFVAGSTKALDELMARDLSELSVAALMIDGVHFAEHLCVAGLAICADGTKVPVGLWLGDTENTTVVAALLADLVDRGLSPGGRLLVVIDGAKALARAVRKVFGDAALIQRCTLHKRRNVADHLPKDTQGWVDQRLARAFNNADPDAGLRAAKALAAQLETRWPDAAASLREGLDDMFTVRRLGVSDRLARTLGCTNGIESMFSVARTTTAT